jgi:hypothetical protein
MQNSRAQWRHEICNLVSFKKALMEQRKASRLARQPNIYIEYVTPTPMPACEYSSPYMRHCEMILLQDRATRSPTSAISHYCRSLTSEKLFGVVCSKDGRHSPKNCLLLSKDFGYRLHQ